MSEFRDFAAEMLERHGAAVEAIEPDGLDVLAPQPLRQAMGWPEMARLGFGAQRPDHAIPIGLEGDWLDRFGTLLGEEGRWAERQVRCDRSIGNARRSGADPRTRVGAAQCGLALPGPHCGLHPLPDACLPLLRHIR